MWPFNWLPLVTPRKVTFVLSASVMVVLPPLVVALAKAFCAAT